MSNKTHDLVGKIKRDISALRERIMVEYIDQAEQALQNRKIHPKSEIVGHVAVSGVPKGDPSLRKKADRKLAKKAFKNAATELDIEKIIDEAV